MLIPENIIANADDFGLNSSVNKAILYCYEQGYINSTSLMVNKFNFEEAVNIVHTNKVIKNVGVHVNLVDGKPVSNFINKNYLTADGGWDLKKTGRKISFLNSQTKKLFFDEISAQVKKVIDSKVGPTHIDSHHHLHTLPAFYDLFFQVARQYKLKLRLAQTYNEGNYLKFIFRKYINRRIKQAGCNYSDFFETVDYYVQHRCRVESNSITEIMLHPDFDTSGVITDHYLNTDMINWIALLKESKSDFPETIAR